jgi:hypothetical protein
MASLDRLRDGLGHGDLEDGDYGMLDDLVFQGHNP